MGLRDELIAVERAFWSAAGDGDFCQRHFADDGVAVIPMNPPVLDKSGVTSAVDAARPWDDVELSEVGLVELGERVAALTYRAAARRGEHPYVVAVTSVYVRNGHGWQLALHQHTPLHD